MKGLAFAVSLFHRLSSENPGRSVEAVVSDVETFAARLVQAGKVVEAAFTDAVTGSPVNAAKAAEVIKREADTVNVTTRAAMAGSPIPAIVGGAVTPGSVITGAGGLGPAPTPPAPGIEGLPSGK